MYFLGLATDYDGTIATDDAVPSGTLDALRRLKTAGGKLLLVTGREVPDLRRVCPDLALFDRVVAENGAVLLDPASGSERLIAAPAPRELVERLTALGVKPLSVGKSVLGTSALHAATVLETIRALGLEMQIIFNKGALMILPPGVNKASGLRAALAELDLSPHNVVGVGDAENDHAFLETCGCAAAVANALPALKAHADVALAGEAGAGVAELVALMLQPDQPLAGRSAKERIRVGSDGSGEPLFLHPFGRTTLITGPLESGKSTLVTSLTERMAEAHFEFCVFDPEGDYFGLRGAVTVGDARTKPRMENVLDLLRDLGVNLVVNTQALILGKRREVFATLLALTSPLRRRSGRPHWLLVDEAHQVFPPDDPTSCFVQQPDMPATILVTAYPEALPRDVLRNVEVAIAFGNYLDRVRPFLRLDPAEPTPNPTPLALHEACYWTRSSPQLAQTVSLERPQQVHRRHKGKYAVGDVGTAHSFYFGESGSPCIQARNLYEFMEIGSSIDDAVWTRHLRASDYSAWFRHVIRDDELAAETAQIETDPHLSATESRDKINSAIRKRYAAPAHL